VGDIKMSNGNFDSYYKQLKGFKIVEYLGTTEDESGYGDPFPRFLLRKKGMEDVMIEVSRDPEGNGGGFLFISGAEDV
jgi:hypothetical protein